MAVSVEDLLAKPFHTRSKDHQSSIILRGKPKPKKFEAELFENEQWLTACDVRNAFFCWPCLLFATDSTSSWRTSGIGENLFNKTVYMDIHNCSQAHIYAVSKLQKFINENLVDTDISKGSKLDLSAKKYREVVRRITDVVCHVASMKPPIPSKNDTCDQVIVANCIECLNLLKIFDPHEYCEEAINVMKQHPSLMKNVLSTLSFLVTQEIKKEIQASHVSLILSEHSEVDLESKLSNIIRYVKDGKVYERLVGFNKVLAYKTSATLEAHISSVLKKLDLTDDRLLTISCDGAVTSQRQLKGLVKSFQSKRGCFAFLPSYLHNFDFVLEQSLSVFLECRFFFQNLRCMKSFVLKSEKIREQFNSLLSETIPNLNNVKLSNSHFLRVLKVHRRKFISIFKHIVENFVEYTEHDVALASGFIIVLEKAQTVFLLQLFDTLFGHLAVFTEALCSGCPENVFNENIIGNVKTTLKEMKATGFKDVWVLSVPGMPDSFEPNENSNLIYFQLFFKIMDHVVNEIDIRLDTLEKLNILQILNSEKDFGMYVLYDEQIQNLKEFFGSYIDDVTLRNEITVINSKNEMLVKDSAQELLETLESKNLGSIFKNVKCLSIFILTLPCKPLPSSKGSSKFDTINSWSNVCGGDLEDIIILAIENDLLERVKSQDRFQEILYVLQTRPSMKVS